MTANDAAGKAHRPRVDLERPDIPNTPAGRKLAKKVLAAKMVEKSGEGGSFKFDNPAVGPPLPEQPTIAQIAERWFALLDQDTGRPKRSTIKSYTSNVNALVLPVFGSHFAPLGVPELRVFLRDLKIKRKPSTIRNTINALTLMFDTAVAEGWIPKGENPVRDKAVRDVMPRIESRDPDDIVQLSIEQVRTLLNCLAIPDDRHGLYLFAVTTGMRDGELRGLQQREVNLDAPIPQFNVRRQLAETRDKGASLRSIRSSPRGQSAPCPCIRAPSNGSAHPCDDPDAFVLGDGTRPNSADLLRADMVAAGLPTEIKGAPVELRAMRHTFATLLGASDVSDSLIDRMLGHAPGSTRARHYQAPSLEAMYRAILTIDLGDNSPPTYAFWRFRISARN